jgi:phosphoglycerol transferase MdoB-like AlkP superfamily enzyme
MLTGFGEKLTVQENLRYLLARILGGLIICVLIFTLSRVFLVFSFVRTQYFDMTINEQFNFWILSLRFDLKVSSIAYVFAVLAGLVTFFNRGFTVFKSLFQIYNFVVIYAALIFSIVNYFYFKTYDKSIDTFIFAITKEDPEAVINTVINDYPFFTGILLLCLSFFLYRYLCRFTYLFFEKIVYIPRKVSSTCGFMLIFLMLFFMLMRGSFSIFPLRQLNAQVTDKSGINYCIPNGPIAFYWAYLWEKESLYVPTAKPSEILSSYRDLGIDIEGNKVSDLFTPLLHKTAHNDFLKTHTPNIVFNVMESMSTHIMSYDEGEKRDLLGELRKHFATDFVFRNFISEGNGTSDSLTRLLVSVPNMDLSTSVYSGQDYICNIAKLFNDAGYETIFITASTASWRNLDNFLKQLNFSRVIERTQVLRDYPDATSGAWGIDDEFLFKETYKILNEQHDKPLFIMTLSISNHPPFRLPKHVKVQKVPLPDDILKRFPYEDTETIFATLRYANDELGKFISRVKDNEKLRNNTFIAATGDHNMRGIGYQNHPEELVFGHEVPFYLYMPEEYVKNTNVHYDKDRLGSQKDIITTMVSHALSDFEFYSFGCDLLSDDKCTFPYAFNDNVVVSYERTHACNMLAYPPLGYNFNHKPYLMVEDKASARDCKKEFALKQLHKQLFYIQAHKGKQDDFQSMKISDN